MRAVEGGPQTGGGQEAVSLCMNVRTAVAPDQGRAGNPLPGRERGGLADVLNGKGWSRADVQLC